MEESKKLYVLRMISVIYWLFLVLFIIGFFKAPPPLFISFTFVVKVSMALFLLYRFNPYSDYKKFTRVDQEIVLFVAGFILVASFTDYINRFTDRLKQTLSEWRQF